MLSKGIIFRGPYAPSDVLGNFFRILEFYWSLPTDEDNRNIQNPGGYLTILERSSGQVIISLRLTNVHSLSLEEADSYRKFSLEKIQRLLGHIADGHLTSWESRDAANEQYGGAILTKDYIVSFSGLPEKWDTIIAAVGSYINFWLEEDSLKEIAARTENENLLQACLTAIAGK